MYIFTIFLLTLLTLYLQEFENSVSTIIKYIQDLSYFYINSHFNHFIDDLNLSEVNLNYTNINYCFNHNLNWIRSLLHSFNLIILTIIYLFYYIFLIHLHHLNISLLYKLLYIPLHCHCQFIVIIINLPLTLFIIILSIFIYQWLFFSSTFFLRLKKFFILISYHLLYFNENLFHLFFLYFFILKNHNLFYLLIKYFL